jgi:hypothetical protein
MIVILDGDHKLDTILNKIHSVENKLDAILSKLHSVELTLEDIKKKEVAFMGTVQEEFAALTDSVAQQTTVINGLSTFLDGLEAQIAAAGTDPAKLAAVRKSITDNTDTISAAVVKGTAAQNEPPKPVV